MKKEDFLLVLAVLAIILCGFALGFGFFTNWQIKSILTGYVSYSENIDISFLNNTLNGIKKPVVDSFSSDIFSG